MKKFSFSLQNVLDFKNQYLDGVKNEYAAAAADVMKQQEVINALKKRYSDTNDEYNRKKIAGMEISDIFHYDTYLKRIENEINHELSILHHLEEIREEKFQVMVLAKQEVTSLEKLREQRLEAYNYQIQKSEELFVEEFVSNKSVSG